MTVPLAIAGLIGGVTLAAFGFRALVRFFKEGGSL